MSDRAIFIQLNSGDFSVDTRTMNSSSFRNTLAQPLVLDRNKEYEVCIYDVFFNVRQTTSSIYVNSNLVSGTIVGSQLTSSLLWIPFSELAGNSDTTLALTTTQNYLFYTTSFSRKWYPLAISDIPYIDISFTLSTGGPMPYQPGDFSTVTIAIREKY